MEKVTKKSNTFAKIAADLWAGLKAFFPALWKGTKTTVKRMAYAFYILAHPFEGFFDLKNDPKRRSVAGGVVWLVLYAVVALLRFQSLGYLFADRAEQLKLNIPVYLITAVLPFVLWAVSNWCFSSLMDGDGKLSDVFMVTAYATLPITICNLIQIPLSHFLSASEASVFTFIGALGIVWGYGYIFLAMIIVHQYSVAKGLGTAILTILGMAVIAFVAILVFFLLQQVSNFFIELGTEVIFRLNE
ncbi:MAG: YIP1 family protein [Clostridia bacterium]|nr:YIP1 family protein [Clostridia bacterium]